MMTKEEQGFSNEFRLTRLAAKIIKANLDKSFIEIGNLIVRDFHSEGVVIKVDRELPTIPLVNTSFGWDKWQSLMKQAIKEAGYVAVEPLVKEVENGE